MSARDLALMLFICLVWALNTIVSKVAVTHLAVPPVFFAAVRFSLVALVTLPWLLPMPRPRWRLVLIALGMGGGSFALYATGLKYATPSTVAVVSQVGVPISVLLSVALLGERIGRRRLLGVVLAFAGTTLVMLEPEGMALSIGLLIVVASAGAASLGAVLMKQMSGVRPLQFQAWVGAVSVAFLPALSFAVEQDQIARAQQAGLSFLGAVLFSALAVSILSHTLFYGLIARYSANVIVPLTLLAPLMTVALGVMLTGDPFDLQMALGTSVAMAGVLLLVLRPRHIVPVLYRLRGAMR